MYSQYTMRKLTYTRKGRRYYFFEVSGHRKERHLSENNGRYSSHSGFELEVGELLSPELLVAAPATGRQAQGCVAGGHILAPGPCVRDPYRRLCY